MPKRVQWVDVLKALGIFAIYIGHFCNDAGKIYPFVYTYHVPLFFVVSGFFAKTKNEESFLLFIKNKFMRIMIPYFIFVFVSGIVYALFMDCLLKDIIIQGFFGIRNQIFAAALWFFPCLFVMSVLYDLLMRLVKKKYLALLVSIILFLITQTLLPNNPATKPSWFWNIDSSMYYVLYYAIGNYLYPIIKNFSFKELDKIWKIIVFCLIGFFCFATAIIVYIKGVNVVRAFVMNRFLFDSPLFYYPLQVFITLVIILANIYLAYFLRNINILAKIGKSTLELCGTEQIFKFFFIKILHFLSITFMLITPVNTFLFTAVCLVVNQYSFAFLINRFILLLTVKNPISEKSDL